jgi:hypothetical protein
VAPCGTMSANVPYATLTIPRWNHDVYIFHKPHVCFLSFRIFP